jgi:hypothetical protein
LFDNWGNERLAIPRPANSTSPGRFNARYTFWWLPLEQITIPQNYILDYIATNQCVSIRHTLPFTKKLQLRGPHRQRRQRHY